ncbi:MAG: hypothetical protein ACW980_25365, partial [Promethearchaeota archaeon]
ISHLFAGHFVFLNFIWIPLAFLFFDTGLKEKKYNMAIFAGFILALQFLMGGIQISFYTIFLLFLWSIYNWNRFNFSFFFITLIIFLGLSSIQIFPTLEFLQHSSRQTSLTYSLTTSPKLRHIIGLFLPYFKKPRFFWETTSYVGVVTLILATLGINNENNKYSRFFLLVSILSILIAFFPPIREYIVYFPGFKSFRAQGRILFLFSFSIAVLSGYGTQNLFEKIKEKNLLSVTTKIALVMAGLVILYVMLSRAIKRIGISKDLYFSIFIFLFIIGSFLAIVRYAAKSDTKIEYFKISLVLLLVYNLWLFGMPLINVKEPAQVFSTSKLIEFLDGQKGSFRSYSTDYDNLPQELTVRNNLHSAGGFDPIILNIYSKFMQAAGNYTFNENSVYIPPWQVSYPTYPNPDILGLLNIKYVITEYPLDNPDFNLVKRFDKLFVYENNRFLPRAFVVHDYKVVKNEKEVLKSVMTIDPRSVVILEKEIGKEVKPPIRYEGVVISHYSANEIIIKTNISNPGILVLSEIWYPGWKVYDNNKLSEILRADYLLRGIFLEEGLHEVRFVYAPASLKIGAMTSLLTLGLIILLIFREKTFEEIDSKRDKIDG